MKAKLRFLSGRPCISTLLLLSVLSPPLSARVTLMSQEQAPSAVIAPPPAAPAPRKPDDHTIQLTPASPSAERVAAIVAPGPGRQNYNLFSIDTRDFPAGGILDIDIEIARDSATAGSFDLFPANFSIPRQGRPGGTLAGRYDIPKGSSTRLEYRFRAGQLFAFGLEGNWGSPAGAAGSVHFRVSVRK